MGSILPFHPDQDHSHATASPRCPVLNRFAAIADLTQAHLDLDHNRKLLDHSIAV